MGIKCSLDQGEYDILLHFDVIIQLVVSSLEAVLGLEFMWQTRPCASSGLMHEEGLAFVLLSALHCPSVILITCWRDHVENPHGERERP